MGSTSATPQKAGPARLLGLARGQWGIENGLRWVRDVTFDEDRCQVRTGSASGDGHTAQPRDRRAALGGRGQHRRRSALGGPSAGVAGPVNPVRSHSALVSQVCPGALIMSLTLASPAIYRQTGISHRPAGTSTALMLKRTTLRVHHPSSTLPIAPRNLHAPHKGLADRRCIRHHDRRRCPVLVPVLGTASFGANGRARPPVRAATLKSIIWQCSHPIGYCPV